MASEEANPKTPPDAILEVPPSALAWQPLTPRGIAAFARAGFGRLFAVELLVAMLAAGAILWFLTTTWFPTVRQAIRQLPDQGEIRRRELHSPRLSAEPLAADRWLSLSVELGGRSRSSIPSDLQLKFQKNGLQICSLLGCLALHYPPGWTVQFSRPELEPWWGAWEPNILWIVGLSAVVLLMLTWAFLASLYFWIARVLGYFADRDLTWGGSWRLAGAALMPGALLLAFAIVLYGAGVIDLIRLAVAFLLHLIAGWAFLVAGTLAVPRLPAVLKPTANPFIAPPER
jgi:hypothetical protein